MLHVPGSPFGLTPRTQMPKENLKTLRKPQSYRSTARERGDGEQEAAEDAEPGCQLWQDQSLEFRAYIVV